jgi:hypothetical protein
MLKAIHSGGQNGADIAGLIVAKEYGLETGGWMPKGFITHSGPHPDWAGQYGLQEHTSPKYSPRTFANVRDSDGTVRFAFDFNSAGERCTLKAIHQYKKPHIDVNLNEQFVKVDAVAEWLDRHSIEVLNIAGNSERTYSGTTGEVIEFLCELFEKLGFEKLGFEK